MRNEEASGIESGPENRVGHKLKPNSAFSRAGEISSRRGGRDHFHVSDCGN